MSFTMYQLISFARAVSISPSSDQQAVRNAIARKLAEILVYANTRRVFGANRHRNFPKLIFRLLYTSANDIVFSIRGDGEKLVSNTRTGSFEWRSLSAQFSGARNRAIFRKNAAPIPQPYTRRPFVPLSRPFVRKKNNKYSITRSKR